LPVGQCIGAPFALACERLGLAALGLLPPQHRTQKPQDVDISPDGLLLETTQKMEPSVPTLNTPNAIAAALTTACEMLFAMIETNPALLPVGERLIHALLHEAETQNMCSIIIIRRLYAGLDVRKRIAAGAMASPSRRGPRLG
jgi:hypothetical protein